MRATGKSIYSGIYVSSGESIHGEFEREDNRTYIWAEFYDANGKMYVSHVKIEVYPKTVIFDERI
jgi:hypothetical protein